MSDKIDDLDLEEDFQDEKSQSNSNPALLALDCLQEQKETKLTAEEKAWEKTCLKMEEHCDHTWICLPSVSEDGKMFLQHGELATCTNEFFFSWLCHVWPPAKTMKHSPKDYSKIQARKNAFWNVTAMHKTLEFPKNADMPDHTPKKKAK